MMLILAIVFYIIGAVVTFIGFPMLLVGNMETLTAGIGCIIVGAIFHMNARMGVIVDLLDDRFNPDSESPDNGTRTDKGGDAVVDELRRNRRTDTVRKLRATGLDDAQIAQTLGIDREEVSKVT